MDKRWLCRRLAMSAQSEIKCVQPAVAAVDCSEATRPASDLFQPARQRSAPLLDSEHSMILTTPLN
eukprot:scaffold5992_cov158-Ochromonas_danica.AAC.6